MGCQEQSSSLTTPAAFGIHCAGSDRSDPGDPAGGPETRLAERRVVLLQIFSQRGTRSTAELTRLAGRPAKEVQSDLRVLVGTGLVELVGTGAEQRPVAAFDRLQLAGDIDIARAAA
jgi:hypothetical protein